MLDVKGRGHYVGCNLSVLHFQGSWWGEGDDMICIDDEEVPSIMELEQKTISIMPGECREISPHIMGRLYMTPIRMDIK